MGKWIPQIKQNREAEFMDFTADIKVERNLNTIAADRPHSGFKSAFEERIMSALKKQGLESEQKIKVKVIYILGN